MTALGIDMVPAVNGPGHALWLLRAHPELREDQSPDLLCTRHPDSQRILTDIYDELLALFPDATTLHVGHDETTWLSGRWFGDERCPRCAASPRAELFADSLRWHIDYARAHGLRAMAWSDQLLEGWNGGREGTFRALQQLDADQRAALIVQSWGPVGDPLSHLPPLGIEVQRVHTGYHDWKRAGLQEQAASLTGEGIAAFLPAPWATLGPASGSRNLQYHLGSVLLAGWTGWRPDLEDSPIAATLLWAEGLPALRPGWAHAPGDWTPAPLSGAGLGIEAGRWHLPARPEVGGLVYAADPHLVRQGQPLHFAVEGPVAALSLLQATLLDHEAELLLYEDLRSRRSPSQQAVAVLRWTYGDGSTADQPLIYGLDSYAPDGDPRSGPQWRTAGWLPLASIAAATTDGAARDHRLYRRDLANPHPDRPLQSVSLVVDRPGVRVLVLGAAQRTAP
jgi:hypothetical protein